jgi:hypothetical protein
MVDVINAEVPVTHLVSISDIVVRDDWQVRTKVREQTVKQYAVVMQGGSEMPPISLAKISGALVLVDGAHRLAAARRIGASDILATVEEMSEEDAAWAAAIANTKHGLRLSAAERFKVFLRYMNEKRYLVSKRGQRVKTVRDIAKDLNGIYSKSGVHRLIQGNYPAVADRMSRGAGEKRRPLDPPDGADAPTAFKRLAWDHMQQILAAARGLPEEEREGAASLLERLAQAVRTATPWEPPEPYKL